MLTRAYLPLGAGTCLQDLELLRHEEVCRDALDARRIPDPTTAGDFCRRFTPEHLQTRHDILDDTRLAVWKQQPTSLFRQAIVDRDGLLVETSGQGKQGLDIADDGTWGYHALVLTLANSGEVLRGINRSGNRPSQEGAAEQVDQAMALCFRGGFGRVLLRGDSTFSHSERLDGWDGDPRLRLLLGYEAMPNWKALAEDLPVSAWKPLFRPCR